MFVPSYTLRIMLLQGEREEELCSTFSIKIPALLHVLQYIMPYLDTYICAARDTSVLKNSHTGQLWYTRRRHLIFKLRFSDESIV